MKFKSPNPIYLLPSTFLFLMSCFISLSVIEDLLAFDGAKTEGVLVSPNGFWKGSAVYLYEIDGKKYRGQSGYNFHEKIKVGDSVDVYYCRNFPRASSLYKKSPNIGSNIFHLSIMVTASFVLLLMSFTKQTKTEETYINE